MAITATSVILANPAGIRFSVVTITPDSSYPTGGEAFTPSNAGFSSAILHAEGISTGGIVWKYIPTTGKLKAFWVDTTVDGAALAEVANTTDLSTSGAGAIFAVGY